MKHKGRQLFFLLHIKQLIKQRLKKTQKNPKQLLLSTCDLRL